MMQTGLGKEDPKYTDYRYWKAERELKKDPAAFSNEKQKTSREVEMPKLDIWQKTMDNLMGL